MEWEYRWKSRMPRPDDVAEPVHDGDTVWLELDRGLDFDRTIKSFRLRDVFMPEIRDPGGQESRIYLAGLLAAGQGKWPSVVQTFKTSSGRDRTTLERFVAEVTVGDMSVNAELRKFIAAHPEWGGGIGG